MKVGWLVDPCVYMGGAEMSAAEFRAAAPEGVEVVACPPDGIQEADRFVIHNCLTYHPDDLAKTQGKPTFKVWHDVGPMVIPEQHEAMAHAVKICVSPLQAEKMGIDAQVIPPALDLDPFREAAENAQDRAGAVSFGRWMGPQKGADQTAEWGKANGGIDFYGAGEFVRKGTEEVPYEQVPGMLARYKTFVHLPREIEPFGRSVVEAWAAGCEIVVNGLVGARYWITEAPEKLDTAAQDFWNLVCAT